MNAAKAILLISLFSLAIVGCSDSNSKRKLPTRHINVSPRKVQLETIESLIHGGYHRKALVLLDSFQKVGNEEIYLIQSEVLQDEALDSLYAE